MLKGELHLLSAFSIYNSASVRLSLAAIATGFALLTADLAAATRLGHAYVSYAGLISRPCI
jgi:hypothetical protein